MTDKREQHEQARRYLLGELSETQQTAAEERFFADEDFSRLLDAAEHDLIDDYLRGELTSGQKQNFESNFLVTERRREKVRAAQILQTQLFTKKAEKLVATASPKYALWQSLQRFFRTPNLVWASGLAAITLVILTGGIWLATQTGDNYKIARVPSGKTGNLEPESNATRALAPPESVSLNSQGNNQKNIPPTVQKNPFGEKSQLKPGTKRVAPKTAVSAPPTFAALILTPMMRSSETPDFVLPRRTQFLRLQLINDDADNFLRYRVEIRNPNGDKILSREISAKINQQLVVIQIPSQQLASGSHEIILTGSETVGGAFKIVNFYSFSLLKK